MPRILAANSAVIFLRKMFAGGGSATGSPEFQLATLKTQTSNSGTSLTDLLVYTLPANTLQNDGDTLEIYAEVFYAANANNKTTALIFGSQVIASRGAAADNNLKLIIRAVVVRTGATTQQASSQMNDSGGALSQVLFTTPAETLSGTVNIRLAGQSGTGSNDVTSRLLQVRYIPVGGTYTP